MRGKVAATKRAFGIVIVTLGIAGAFANTARADTAAEGLFRAGREAMKQGDLEQGCNWFRESNRLEPALGTQLNLAICEEALGHLTRAHRLFREVAAALPAADERVDIASGHARDLEARIPRILLQVHVPLPSGSRIVVAGQELTAAALGAPIPLDPGTHGVEVQAPGHVVRRYDVRLSEGATQLLVLEPGLRISPPPVPRAQVSAKPAGAVRSADHRTWAIVAFGVAGSALSVSAVAGLAVMETKETFEQECDRHAACSVQGLRAAERGETLSDVGTGAFLVALASAAVGGVLLWLDREAERGGVGAVSAHRGNLPVRVSF
jgi:hypothetical protein